MAQSLSSADSPGGGWKVLLATSSRVRLPLEPPYWHKGEGTKSLSFGMIAAAELTVGQAMANFWGAPLDDLPSAKRPPGFSTRFCFHCPVSHFSS